MLHPANLGQLLEDTTLLLVCKELLELPLCVAKTRDARRHPRWGTIQISGQHVKREESRM
jgi:hypothetical protein